MDTRFVDPDTPKVQDDEKREFDQRLLDAQSREEQVSPVVNGQRVIWFPQPGSQTDFLQCPLHEALYHGTRGNGNPTPSCGLSPSTSDAAIPMLGPGSFFARRIRSLRILSRRARNGSGSFSP